MEGGSSYEATKQEALIGDCMLVQSIAAMHMTAILFTYVALLMAWPASTVHGQHLKSIPVGSAFSAANSTL
jgi:hypothetical protein